MKQKKEAEDLCFKAVSEKEKKEIDYPEKEQRYIWKKKDLSLE